MAPHAEAAKLLSNCLSALKALPVTAVQSNTPLVPKMNRLASAANQRCAIAPRIDDLSYHHRSDKALAHAYNAAASLSIGTGDYVQYLVDVAFGRQNKSALHRAVSEIATGKRLAVIALRELR